MGAFVETPFGFEIDVEVFHKSGEKNPRRIGGYVTTDDLDQQGETIIQEGLDFGHFLKKGWFNDNHGKATTDIVGYPESAELLTKGGKKGWYVEGHLLEGHVPSDRLWELANALQKSKRRLGFSVEGKIQERHGENNEVIAKALVKNVAITNCAVNDVGTQLNVLAKSLSAAEQLIEKAMSMGTGGVGVAGGVPYREPVTGAGGAGQVITPQSLEGAHGKGCECPACKKRKGKRGMKKSAAVAFLMDTYGISASLASDVFTFTAQRKARR